MASKVREKDEEYNLMEIKFDDIMFSFEFVSGGQMYEHQAFLDTETGKIYWQSDFMDDEEELPDDIDDAKYIEIPHKNEFDLGQKLVIDFAYEHLPSEVDRIAQIFRRKGAYSKFRSLLERKDALEKWYEYEDRAKEKALKEWCEANNIKAL